MKRRLTSILTTIVVCVGSLIAMPELPAHALAGATQVSLSQWHACAIDSAGAAWCWGRNLEAEVGDGTYTNRSVPTAVAGGHAFTQIAVGLKHSCGIDTSQNIWCWGNGYISGGSALGDGATQASTTPVEATGGYHFVSVAAGDSFTCGVTDTHAAYCWGDNYAGKLGNGGSSNSMSPVLVSGSHLFLSISIKAEGEFACGLTTSGTAYCWGDNGSSQLGVGTGGPASANTPQAVTGGRTFTQLSAGNNYVCGVTSGYVAYCWGIDNGHQLGDNGWSNQDTPQAVLGGISFTSIFAGGGTTCGVDLTNTAYCWGWNGNGEVGDGTTTLRGAPVLVSTSSKFSSISSDDNDTCGTTVGGSILCWGANEDGLLGNNATADELTPQPALFIYGSNNSTISVAVDPSFTFTVGTLSSACNGESNFANVGTSSSVPLAHLAAGASVSGGQTLSVASNAGGGFAVYVRGTQSSQNLHSSGHNWTDVAGSYASPAALGSGERFGYTYKDSTTSSSVTNPGSALYAALDSTNRAVAGSSSSTSGSACISYTAQASATTPAASYSATIIYVAVPSF